MWMLYVASQAQHSSRTRARSLFRLASLVLCSVQRPAARACSSCRGSLRHHPDLNSNSIRTLILAPGHPDLPILEHNYLPN